MKQDKAIELAKTLSDGWWLDDEKLMAFVKLVETHTLMNIDPSSFMSYQEGFEAGNRLAIDGICKQLRQLHDSYSLASNPLGLKVKNDH